MVVVVVVGEVDPPVDGAAVVVGDVDPPVDGAWVVVGDVGPPEPVPGEVVDSWKVNASARVMLTASPTLNRTLTSTTPVVSTEGEVT